VDITTIITLAGLGLRAGGLVVAAVGLSRRVRQAEIDAAEERGKMCQRMADVEKDVNNIGCKIRGLEEEQHDIRQVLVRLETGQEYIITTLNELKKDQKQHERDSAGWRPQ